MGGKHILGCSDLKGKICSDAIFMRGKSEAGEHVRWIGCVEAGNACEF